MLLSRRRLLQGMAALPFAATRTLPAQDWPAFRGSQGRGVADGFALPESWNADSEAGAITGIRWRREVPGLGHSSPIVWGDRIFVPTAIAKEGSAPLALGAGGGADAADDQGEQSWVVLCYRCDNGEEVWRQTARSGPPHVSRHVKATHANTTLATDGKHLVAFFGSEGLYCYDLNGELLWQRDLGVINISKYGIGWGYASSPVIFEDRLVLLCDDPDRPFLVCLRLSDGEELWRVSRNEISDRSWATPLVHASGARVQVVINGWPWIVSYDLRDGAELWRLSGGGDNPVPTPFVANEWIYLTNAHGGPAPIYVIRPDATGDLTQGLDDASPNAAMVWTQPRGGSYMSTPVVYGDYIYVGNTNGVVRCFDAKTGEKIYEERLDSDAAMYASLVAADGKIYCPAENGSVYVIQAGPEYQLLARNRMGEPCFGTPAISNGALYLRTTKSLVAVG